MDECNIKVSICCLTYNHEKYIRQALDSFLMQKTNFKYEILIHDDASTDKTAEIIREYEEKYPDIIKPIYQTENQYKQRVKISWKYQFPRAKGKYIAMCEGDDFWSDDNKLQLQYETLESNGAVFCAHQVRFVTESGEKTERKKPDNKQDYYQSGEEFLKTLLEENICPFQTSSYMFRREVIMNECVVTPEFIKMAQVGDVTLMMLLATKGDMCYLNREMSCYRMHSVSSWSLSQIQDKTKRIRHEEKLREAFEAFNIYTNYDYDEFVRHQITVREFNVLKIKELYKEMLNPPFLELVKKWPLKDKIYVHCSAKLPALISFYKRLKG